jgi:hypothetical protein
VLRIVSLVPDTPAVPPTPKVPDTGTVPVGFTNAPENVTFPGTVPVLVVAIVVVRVARSVESVATDCDNVSPVTADDVDETVAKASLQKANPAGSVSVSVRPATKFPADVSVTTTAEVNGVHALPPPAADELSSEIEFTLPEDTVAARAPGTTTNATKASTATKAPAIARRRDCGANGRRRRGTPTSRAKARHAPASDHAAPDSRSGTAGLSGRSARRGTGIGG